jgi:GDSL-like Lipase/Acylhydrolase family
MRTRRVAMAIAAAVVLTVPGALVVSSTAQAAPIATSRHGFDLFAPSAFVSLGDSYISGEAGRWKGNAADPAPGHAGTDRAVSNGTADPARIYGPTAGTCDRSDVAPVRSTGLPFITPINLACSGAKTQNVLRAASGGVAYQGEAPQNDQLAQVARTHRVRLIALSIGGNDLGFASALQSCIVGYLFRTTPCSATQQPVIQQRLPEIQAKVEAVVRDIRATMTAAGYGQRDYVLVVESYPSPLATAADLRYPEDSPERTAIGGCPFYDVDADWAGRSLVPALTGALAAAARATGSRFLDLSGAFAGHELCSRQAAQSTGAPSSGTDEWVRFIDLAQQGTTAESLHPNYFGQQALGRCLGMAAIAFAVSHHDLACQARPGGDHAVYLERLRNPAQQKPAEAARSGL